MIKLIAKLVIAIIASSPLNRLPSSVHIDHCGVFVAGGFAAKCWDIDGDDELRNGEHQQYSSDPHSKILQKLNKKYIKPGIIESISTIRIYIFVWGTDWYACFYLLQNLLLSLFLQWDQILKLRNRMRSIFELKILILITVSK